MARIRTVKPKLFTHEGLFDAEHETGLPLRLAFIGLFTEADREGRFQWRPRTLKAAILPFDEIDFEAILDALVRYGFIVKYPTRNARVPHASTTRNGRVNDASTNMLKHVKASFSDDKSDDFLGCIPTFRLHQAINNREPPSELDAPDPSLIRQANPDASSTRGARVKHASADMLKSALAEGEGVNTRRDKNKNPRSFTSHRSASRARASVATTGRDATAERLLDVFERRGCALTPKQRVTLDAAEAEGVSAATLDHAIDDAQARPEVGSVAAYALKTARKWQRENAEPLASVDAGAIGHVNGRASIAPARTAYQAARMADLDVAEQMREIRERREAEEARQRLADDDRTIDMPSDDTPADDEARHDH